MKFVSLPVAGAFQVLPAPHEDDRGSFARVWSSAAFAELGLAPGFAETSLSRTSRRGTLRGIHYQVAPHAEAKLVTCLQGEIWDVILDLRPESSTYRCWHGGHLAAAGAESVYIPEGVAHGLLTLTDDVQVLYQISAIHDPSSARGVRWDDPTFAIDWPANPSILSERDRSFPDYLVDDAGVGGPGSDVATSG
jgi:dTDP-4-dehydrorhamnose 3,5-epimerase